VSSDEVAIVSKNSRFLSRKWYESHGFMLFSNLESLKSLSKKPLKLKKPEVLKISNKNQ
jgi:hypothetical protein